MYFLDRYGYPVERIEGRPVTNFIRLCLHTRKITTARPRCLDPVVLDGPMVMQRADVP